MIVDGPRLRSTVFRWSAVVGWMAMVFVLSSLPDIRVLPAPETEYALRKAAHMVVFGILALLVAWAWPWRHRLLAAFVLTGAYAIIDEVHQSFVRGRFGDPVDVAIDALGAAIALVLLSRRTSRASVGRR